MRLPFGSGLPLHQRTYTIATTAFVSTYPPQRCGIASFTSDLAAAVGDREIVALQPPVKPGFYPTEVSRRIARDVLADYLSAARWIDGREFEVVSLQHEYGIWGGEDGAYVLDFIKALRTPVVATLHTVLQNPTPAQRSILTELVKAAAETVVMSTAAASLMTRSYGIDPKRLEIIPHGVPKLPFVAPDTVKSQLGLAGHTVILSFGLLGPGKGYQSAINAMPAVVAADPTALYVIVGATHPDLIRAEGEAYREKLVQLASSLGVAGHVRFVGRFVTSARARAVADRRRHLRHAVPEPGADRFRDAVVRDGRRQGDRLDALRLRQRAAGGGTRPPRRRRLYRRAGGRPDRAGNEQSLRADYGRRAYEYSQEMHWPEIGAAYRKVFTSVAQGHPRRADNAAHRGRVGRCQCLTSRCSPSAGRTSTG